MPDLADAPARSRRLTALLLLLLALLLAWSAPGLVSSNDGSHLALARALVLHGRTDLGDEVALTLWVDRARRDGRDYSDRPPGTALLAAPAVWLGAQLDPALLRKSLDTHDVVISPAAPRYAETYAIRVQRQHVAAPPLLALQGTALLLSLHCAALGVLGILGVLLLLRRRRCPPAAQAFAAAALALASLWGPYSTVLFSHVTAGTGVVWFLFALEVGTPPDAPPRRLPLLAAGLAAGWAASADYLVALLLALALATVPPRRWLSVAPWLLLGALPILGATPAYHTAAFGSPWSLGYDHHANFAFARDRLATFGGNPLLGLWSQWGLGQGAGLLALAPVMLIALPALVRAPERRWLLAALPWILLLAAHRTPTGGAAADHRYLIPLLPLMAIGLARAWSYRPRPPFLAAAYPLVLLLLALLSAALTWTHVHTTWT